MVGIMKFKCYMVAYIHTYMQNLLQGTDDHSISITPYEERNNLK